MNTPESFLNNISHPVLEEYLWRFEKNKSNYFSDRYHGDFSKWNNALNTLLEIKPPAREIFSNLEGPAITIGNQNDLLPGDREKFKKTLKEFMPWRKGPYEIFGIKIDTEWRSDWKWDRVKEQINSLNERTVLDIGCGNGYHCWRMLGAGAKAVLGIDPMLQYIMQYSIFKSYLQRNEVLVLPQRTEDLPLNMKTFDTVFSMGVFYHRRSPLDHLYDLRNLCCPGGEVVLETLVIDGAKGNVLVPDDRYARMRNVWFIPTVLTLESWLVRCGYINIRLADVHKTSRNEQRVTEWMQYESLEHFLDPNNPEKTIEGYPAPKRAIFIAEIP